MCGLLFTNNPDIDKNKFLSALNLMEHRGPDSAGCYDECQQFKFGHNRLKILDLDNRSNQPYWSHNQRYIMVYNGEIYNFKELAVRYQVNTETTSDTEVLLELYVQLGSKMLKELNGMFALVIYDTKTRELFIARDRLGIKPLYVCQKNDVISVSSEIAALLELTGKTVLDEVGLRQYRKLRTFFNGRTLYAGIEMFPAGFYQLNDRRTQYWELPLVEESASVSDEELYELLVSSVNYRCLSDVSVGSYLSGGVDSTIIAALAAKPYTWTVGFKNYNEFDWGELAAQHIQSTHQEVIITHEEFLSTGRQMIKKRKEPLSVPNEVLLYKMTKSVKEQNTVILSGEGADELFFGYDRIFRWAAREQWDLEKFSQLYAYGSNDDLEIIEDALSPFKKYGKPIAVVAAFFQVAHLHGLLRRLDNSTMLCSVEARVPFVDHRLIERMAGISFEFRMANGIAKAPLKRVFEKFLPDEIIKRKKVGFLVPLADIFKDKIDNLPNYSPMDAWLGFNMDELGCF